MDIKQYMQRSGYSRRDSNHIIVEQDGKLWLAFASQGAASFMSSASQSAGVLEIGMISNGEPQQYDYTATEGMIIAKSEKGTLKIVIDKTTNAILFEGEGVSLRLDAKSAPQHATSLKTESGVELTIGGGRYFFKTLTGTTDFDDSWLVSQFHSVTPVLEITPENGKLVLAAYDLPAEMEPVTVTKTADECAADNEAEFSEFCKELVETPSEWDDIREKIAYLLWIGHKKTNQGDEIVVGNKLKSPRAESWCLAVASLAFADTKKSIGLLTAQKAGSPPVLGYAALRLFEDDMFNGLSRSKIVKLYELLGDEIRKYNTNRTAIVPDLSFYAYRFETGKRVTALFSAGEPVAAPDLNTYLILLCDALSQMAEHLYDGGEAIRYREQVKDRVSALIGNLWNGEAFTGMNVYTRERSDIDAVLSYIPLLLGKRLPVDMAEKLAKSFKESDGESAIGALVVLGIYASGQTERAKEIAEYLMKRARADGVQCPFYGAALLALASKTLI